MKFKCNEQYKNTPTDGHKTTRTSARSRVPLRHEYGPSILVRRVLTVGSHLKIETCCTGFTDFEDVKSQTYGLDMDLIEVLWKQDVDMGFSLDESHPMDGPQATKVLGEEIENALKFAEEELQKEKEFERMEKEKQEIEEVKASLLKEDGEIKEDDPWAGLPYTVDTETAVYAAELVNVRFFVNIYHALHILTNISSALLSVSLSSDVYRTTFLTKALCPTTAGERRRGGRVRRAGGAGRAAKDKAVIRPRDTLLLI
ncbi:hypothetical protein EVAR_22300_1 [Eumeta japonica]|uniref:Uncharacterized protein n=1 Tax=Eumeta variegata TaxID=151549 RepID=A0A4C1UBD2_EUMVA|nr:hypothetical protein EVAR_22300_1 [Eumeta japonica]